VFGPVASDPTVSRLIDALASGGPKALAAIRTARAHVREHVWKLPQSVGVRHKLEASPGGDSAGLFTRGLA
jgi:hypothetical protein